MGAGHDSHFIARLAWDAVARRVAAGSPAILPIGAAAKQHGFHLPLDTDRRQAEWFAAEIAERIDALIWPTVTYGYYPAFVEYPGSTSLSSSTFEAVIHEIASGILDAGCTTLFVLNTGISTEAPVERALIRLDTWKVHHLRAYGGPRYISAAETLSRQSHGSHADELETSLMLAIAPDMVDMARAEASPAMVREVPGRLTPTDTRSPNFSRSGSYGDPTLATAAKGEVLLTALLDDLHKQAAAAMDASR
ncbi:creatininase family protein [Bradyrhizobium jicamae]|uniref:creatininase family protein n=1 Tax=Bradyrhizobium jicamae TaxID=280332 RepID=UPI001BA8A5D9|nr:creatininase family protein [Bradyrhizobium jicamae]MBR0938054.1 creatininase family protein [Bradyrhizobium jicamae]